MSAAAWPAPAKLNLFLHVVGRRPDGYHELQTLFQLVDLTDELRVDVRPDGEIRRIGGPAGVPPEQDLAVRAARLLKRTSGSPLGADLTLVKRIPLGGGLGGGSSDAATTLAALNVLWRIGASADDLARLGLSLGADVPVFLFGHSAWAEGVGERLTAVDLPPRWYAIVRPPVAVGTAEVFQAPELTRNSPRTTIGGFLEAGGRNDCEPVVAARYPEVRKALERLGRFGPARLTGTGSCVFAAFGRAAEAEEAIAGLPAGWRGFAVRGLARSPLLERLEAGRAGR
ncbi:MAG: 4-(cytidine 5'-diphospho)-2-C-methyl-D-erythritol kinase [Steroidobacteraceae bacterium]|nr:4-(cytidine 5'-diphospho)-2-C-methyl-D-erythritol kinase [Steroidobacteraceae bacterium]